MKWRINVAPSIFSAITEDKTIYRVHLLDVNLDDDLTIAFHSFWKELLTYTLKNDSSDWEILLVELYTGDGMVVGYLTTQNGENDQSHIYKILSTKMEKEYASYDGEEADEEAELEKIEKKYWGLLKKATEAEDIQALLSKIRETREMPVWGIDYDWEDTRRFLDI